MSKGPINLEQLKFEEAVTAALIGVSTVVVVQLLQLTTFDLPLKIALYCFSISIPMLTSYLIMVLFKADYTISVKLWIETIPVSIGANCSAVGMGAIFWHFSMRAGITFIVASLLAFVMVRAWTWKMGKLQRAEIKSKSA